MTTITTSSPRQVYDMCYRLVAQRATVLTRTQGSLTGLITGTAWRKDPGLRLSVDNQPGSPVIAWDDILSIKLL